MDGVGIWPHWIRHVTAAAVADIPSPSLLIDLPQLTANLDQLVASVGNPQRLRPHCKTHKLREVIQLLLARGVTKHKCATLAEAEMLASCGVNDVLLAYPVVGPNVARVVQLLRRYPGLRFLCTVDQAQPLELLSAALSAAGQTVEVLLDCDVGQQRTGIPLGLAARALYARCATLPGVRPGGLHVYDGHNSASNPATRSALAAEIHQHVESFRQLLMGDGWPVPRIVAGGSPTYLHYAALAQAPWELSPGTVVLHDAGYAIRYPDLPFAPAAALLTRVVSQPRGNRLTLDAGHKAIAADPPAGERLILPALPSATVVLHSEEHVVLHTEQAGDFAPGEPLLAIPTHVCPTCALHREVVVLAHNRVVETWNVASRDRV